MELKQGWLNRQFDALNKPYTDKEFESLVFPYKEGEIYPCMGRLMATVRVLQEEIKMLEDEKIGSNY